MAHVSSKPLTPSIPISKFLTENTELQAQNAAHFKSSRFLANSNDRPIWPDITLHNFMVTFMAIFTDPCPPTFKPPISSVHDGFNLNIQLRSYIRLESVSKFVSGFMPEFVSESLSESNLSGSNFMGMMI